MELCINCQEDVHTLDEKTGVIHKSGKYACFPNVKQHDPRWGLVAESMTLDPEEDVPEYSGATI